MTLSVKGTLVIFPMVIIQKSPLPKLLQEMNERSSQQPKRNSCLVYLHPVCLTWSIQESKKGVIISPVRCPSHLHRHLPSPWASFKDQGEGNRADINISHFLWDGNSLSRGLGDPRMRNSFRLDLKGTEPGGGGLRKMFTVTSYIAVTVAGDTAL